MKSSNKSLAIAYHILSHIVSIFFKMNNLFEKKINETVRKVYQILKC